MLYATEGIVLNFIKYKETSLIAKIFTREFGLKSYFVNGIRTSKNSKVAFFQPLTLLNLVVYNRPNVSLNRISEIHCAEPFSQLNRDPLKIMVSFFLTEIINKTIREEMMNEELFCFIKDSLKTLDNYDKSVSSFHLIFLIKFSAYLGFMPASAKQLLDHCEIHFVAAENDTLNAILAADYHDEIKIEGYVRKKILQLLLRFYALNIEGMDNINSARILSEVLSGK